MALRENWYFAIFWLINWKKLLHKKFLKTWETLEYKFSAISDFISRKLFFCWFKRVSFITVAYFCIIQALLSKIAWNLEPEGF